MTDSDTNAPASSATNEIWKPIEGYVDYQISSFGRVKLLDGRITIGTPTTANYYLVWLRNAATKKHLQVSRLVAFAFAPRPINFDPKLYDADHIDGDPTNNRATNIQWLTRSDNNKKKLGPHSARGLRRPILQHSLEGVFFQEWPTADVAASSIGVTRNAIIYAANHQTICRGWRWEYKPAAILRNEVWKTLILHDHPIEVSDQGRIKLRNRVGFGTAHPNGRRYVHVNRHQLSVHRLVAMAHWPEKFLDNREDVEVYHLDGQADNNKLRNLEVGKRAVIAKYSHNKPIQQLDHIGTVIASFPSITDAALAVNGSLKAISRVLRGKSLTSAGYMWKYGN